MSLKKDAEALRALAIYNNYNLLERFGTPEDYALSYATPDRVRSGHASAFSPVPRAGFEHGWTKTFLGKSTHSIPAAIEWAEAKFKLKAVKSPFGGYVSEPALRKAMEALRSPR